MSGNSSKRRNNKRSPGVFSHPLPAFGMMYPITSLLFPMVFSLTCKSSTRFFLSWFQASAFAFLRENRVELVRLAPKAFRQRIPEGLRSEAPTADATEDSGYYLGATAGVQYGDGSAAGWAGQGAYCGYEVRLSEANDTH